MLIQFSLISAAVGEVVFKTGYERNADIVFAAAYAPTLEDCFARLLRSIVKVLIKLRDAHRISLVHFQRSVLLILLSFGAHR